jgi:hypothetical protein
VSRAVIPRGVGELGGHVLRSSFLPFRRSGCGWFLSPHSAHPLARGMRSCYIHCMVLSAALTCGSQQVEQAGHKPADIGCQGRRGQGETTCHADNRLPHTQAGIPAQHNHRSGQQHGNRNRDRQTLTPFPTRGQDGITTAVVSRRRRPAAICDVASGHGQRISRTCRCRPGFARDRRTTGRRGSR